MRYAYNTNTQRLAPLQMLVAEIQRPISQTASDDQPIFDIYAGDDIRSEPKATFGFYDSGATKLLGGVHSSYKNHTEKFYACQEKTVPTKKEIDSRITTWLRNRTAEENWTAREMAQEIGISPQHLDALYQGRRGYGKKTVERIEKRFKTTYTTITGLDTEKKEMRDTEALLEEWKGLALHYKKLYEDLQKKVDADPLSLGPPTRRGGR